MRPAYKVLKALLQHEAWQADWYIDATGAFRTDMQLTDATTASLFAVTVCPLGWLEWQLNHDFAPLMEAEMQEPFLPYTPEVVQGTYRALNLDSHEARYVLSLHHALARILGIDPSVRQALRVAAPFRLSKAEKAAARQRAEQRRAWHPKRPRWEIHVVWSALRSALPLVRYKRFAQALEGVQTMIMLCGIEGEQYQAFFQYDGDMAKRRN
jgi:hypothetical protein